MTPLYSLTNGEYQMNNPKYKVELFLSAVSIKAKNKSFADLDSFLVEVIEEHGMEVESILSTRTTDSDWIKSPHKH